MSDTLPPNPSLDHLKHQARDLQRAHSSGDAAAIARVEKHLPDFSGMLILAKAQTVIAREYGFESWPKLRSHVETVELMDDAWSARRDEKLPEAHRNLSDAVSRFRESGATSELLIALGRLAHVELDLGNDDSATRLYEEGVAIAHKAGDPFALAHKVRHLGDIHRRLGRLDEAETCYEEAILLYRDHEHPPTLDFANVIRPMAIVKEDLGLTEEARKLWTEARDLYAAVEVSAGVEECEDHLARLDG